MKQNILILLSINLLLASCNFVDDQKKKVERIAAGEGEELLEEIYGTKEKEVEVDFSNATPMKPREITALLPMSFSFSDLPGTFDRKVYDNHYGEASTDPRAEETYHPTSEVFDTFGDRTRFEITIEDGAQMMGNYFQTIRDNINKDGEYKGSGIDEGQSSRNINYKGHRIAERIDQGKNKAASITYIKQNRYLVTLVGRDKVTLDKIYEYFDALNKIDFPE